MRTLLRTSAFLACAALAGCSSTLQTAAVVAEKGLMAGSAALDTRVDQVIDKCRAEGHDSVEGRRACVGDIYEHNRKAEQVVQHAVVVLRAFWTASAAADEGGALAALQELADLVQSLPPEYFAGVQKQLSKVKR